MRPSFTSQDSFNNSPKYQSILPKSALDIEVVAYHPLNEGIMYDDHIFIINIHCDSIYYSIERSYIDFIELHNKIKKRFPQCEIPSLPLDAVNTVTKSINKDDTRKLENRKSLNSLNSFESPKKLITNESPPRDSRSFSRAGSGFRIDLSSNGEDLQSKIPELQIYMRILLTFHEIVVSDEFYIFLDEERPCNFVFNYVISDVPSEIDLLLMNTPSVTTTVRKSDEVILDVLPGQLVIWKFYLESYDIGFQVEVDGEIKVSYTRYSGVKSHPIIGSLEVGMRGKCFLKWDNSYAKLRNKELTRQIRVVDPDQYNTAKSACLDQQRERRKYESQRKSLRHATLRHAAAVSGVIHSSSVTHEIDEEDSLIIKEMREELDLARKEKEDISVLLQRTLAEVEELHEQNNELNTHIDNNAARLAELDEELAHSDHHIDNLEARINLLEQEKSELQTQVKDLTDVVDAASVASQLAAEQKRELIEQYTQQINELESKLSQTTNRVEDSDSTNGSLSAENLRLEKELEKSNEIVRDLKAEILQLLEAKTNSDAMIEELRMQLSDLQQDYDSILTSEKEARQLLEAANDQVSQAELRAEKCRQECDAAKLEVIELGEQIERIKWRSKEEIDGWSEKITELEKQLEAARIESASSKETLLKQHEAQSLLAIEELRKEIHQLTEALSQSETLQNNLVAQLSGKDEQILLHEGELSKTATELTYLKGVIDSLNHDLMIEKSQRLTFEEKNIQLNTELDVTRGQIEQMQQSSQSSDKSLDLHSPQLNQSLERALQDLRDEREKYDSYRTKKDQEILELHKQLIVSQEKLENIQKQYREMAETVESERKNRTALLNESKQELQETKKQLAEALKKISNSDHGSLSRRQSRSMNRLLDDEIGDSDDDLERAMIVKHHRDLAAARAEVADLAQQLVESAHREDEMQQCITDLQQEISIIMSHMNQLQQQLQIQGQANYVRQSNAHLLSERGSSSSSSPSKITTDFSPNYELIEKYKQLYNETLERCQLLQNEIIEEKEQMNQKVYNLTSTLHDEINELQTENIELKKELYELRQVYKENLQKRRSLDMNNLTTNELIEKQKEMYQNSLERCQYLENEIIKEKELNNMKVNEMMIEYNQEIQQLQEKNQYLENFINDLQSRYDESIQEINLLKEKEKEKNKELYETQQQLKFIKNSFQDIAKPLNRLLSQEDRIIES